MSRKSRTAIAVIGLGLPTFFASNSRAINAVYVGGPIATGSNTEGGVEVQGITGRMFLPAVIQGPATTAGNSSDSITGATANDSVLYTLLANSASPGTSTISENDTHSGNYLSSIQLPENFSDIAYTNGQLYGVRTLAGSGNIYSIELDSIGTDGTITPLVTQSTNAGSMTKWRLSGEASGDSLFVVPGGNSGSTTGYEFTPTTPTSLTSVALPSVINRAIDTVIHANNSSFSIVGSEQIDYTYPGVAYLSVTTQIANKYGHGSSVSAASDEFNYSYNASQPAVAILGGAFSIDNSNPDGLYRTAQTIYATAVTQINNGVVPDGVSLSNVAATNIFEQNYGAPLAIQIQETDAPAGSFSERALAQASVSINLSNASRGVYGFGSNSNVTADYTVDNTVQAGRPVSVNINSEDFAYDPPSSNIVGNGDGALNGFGWETIDGNSGSISHGYGGISSIGLGLVVNKGDPQSLQQILLLPTASSAMLLSFDYEAVTSLSGSTDLSVFLNGVLLANLVVESATPANFQMMVDDPALEGLLNADLTFTATVDSAATSTTTWVGLGDISLSAIPEPSATTVLGSAVICTLARHRKRALLQCKFDFCNNLSRNK